MLVVVVVVVMEADDRMGHQAFGGMMSEHRDLT